MRIVYSSKDNETPIVGAGAGMVVGAGMFAGAGAVAGDGAVEFESSKNCKKIALSL